MKGFSHGPLISATSQSVVTHEATYGNSLSATEDKERHSFALVDSEGVLVLCSHDPIALECNCDQTLLHLLVHIRTQFHKSIQDVAIDLRDTRLKLSRIGRTFISCLLGFM